MSAGFWSRFLVPPGAWLLAVQVALVLLLLATVWNRCARALAEAAPPVGSARP